jgi:hypothetical protein
MSDHHISQPISAKWCIGFMIHIHKILHLDFLDISFTIESEASITIKCLMYIYTDVGEEYIIAVLSVFLY